MQHYQIVDELGELRLLLSRMQQRERELVETLKELNVPSIKGTHFVAKIATTTFQVFDYTKLPAAILQDPAHWTIVGKTCVATTTDRHVALNILQDRSLPARQENVRTLN